MSYTPPNYRMMGLRYKRGKNRAVAEDVPVAPQEEEAVQTVVNIPVTIPAILVPAVIDETSVVYLDASPEQLRTLADGLAKLEDEYIVEKLADIKEPEPEPVPEPTPEPEPEPEPKPEPVIIPAQLVVEPVPELKTILATIGSRLLVLSGVEKSIVLAHINDEETTKNDLISIADSIGVSLSKKKMNKESMIKSLTEAINR